MLSHEDTVKLAYVLSILRDELIEDVQFQHIGDSDDGQWKVSISRRISVDKWAWGKGESTSLAAAISRALWELGKKT